MRDGKAFTGAYKAFLMHYRPVSQSLWRILPAFVCLLACLTQPAHAQEANRTKPTGTLEDLLQHAIGAFTSQDWQTAADTFEALERDFGREAMYKKDSMQMVLLPAWGYAEFMVEDYDRAVELLERFLERYPDAPKGVDAALYTIAQAQEQNENLREAVNAFERFKTLFPGRPESGLAWLEQARLLFLMSENDEAFDLLQRFYESDGDPKMRIQGRLLALKTAADLGEEEQAEYLLLKTPWTIDKMPELAVLAFAALKIGDSFMERERYAEALKAYRLVPPRQTLIRLQERRLEQVEREAAYKLERLARSPTAAFWRDYYNKLLGKLKGQLKGLTEGDDYTPSFLLRYGQVFLLLKRPHEAWIVYERLALNDHLPLEIREQAHFRWIVSAHQMQRWDDALMIARGFVDTYPDSPLATRALYMIAEAHQELSHYADAIVVLTDLIDNYSSDPMAPRWHFIRGFNYTLMNDNLAARADFASYVQKHPEGIINLQARLWHALTFFFEKEYPEAIKHFDALLPRAQNHPLLPEIIYRKCATLYAMRDFETSLPLINQYLSSYPRHNRVGEARVLRGDILMGQGELQEAIAAFKAVGPEAGALFPYAVFQIGKIHKARAGAWEDEHPEDATREWDNMISHFKHYLAREDVPNKMRISEALYNIGTAYTEKGELQQAFPIFLSALEEFGDAMSATEIPFILQGMGKLHKRFHRDEPENIPEHPIFQLEDYNEWIELERNDALTNERYTYYSRLCLYLARTHKKRNPNQAQAAIIDAWERTPIEKLDAVGLGEIGVLVLDTLDSPEEAKTYFDTLMEKFPTDYARAFALYGLGKIHFREFKFKRSEGLSIPAEEQLGESKRNLYRFMNETPVHPLMPDVVVLLGEVLTEEGQYDKAKEALENLLRIKTARGKPHARALLGLCQLHHKKGELKKAFAYAQRVYTTYRAYPALVAEAYVESARLLEKLDDVPAAWRTYDEMLNNQELVGKLQDLKDTLSLKEPWLSIAKDAHQRLEPLVPEEQRKPPVPEDEEAPTEHPAPAAATKEAA